MVPYRPSLLQSSLLVPSFCFTELTALLGLSHSYYAVKHTCLYVCIFQVREFIGVTPMNVSMETH
jgi:hypothetical protein